jgi:hypothetical protein
MTPELVKPIEILLVEDNPGDVRLTMEALKEAKVAVLERVWTRYWSHLESTLEQAKAGGEHREPMLTTIQRHARVLQNLHDEVA